MRPTHRKMLFALSIALLITCLSTSLTFAQAGAWTLVSSPNSVTGAYNFDRLQAVAAVSASNVRAVGYYGSNSSGNTKTLIEHWNSASWNVVASPTVPSGP